MGIVGEELVSVEEELDEEEAVEEEVVESSTKVGGSGPIVR